MKFNKKKKKQQTKIKLKSVIINKISIYQKMTIKIRLIWKERIKSLFIDLR